MVAALLEGLGADPEIQVFHVNPRLSRNDADIGRWRPGKFFALLAACVAALRIRARHGPMFFYYVPAPARRAALYRDWLVLLLCRPWFTGLVLHWHAAGLGEWIRERASGPERWISVRLLGRAASAIVLGEALRGDAAVFHPDRLAVVRNGIADPVPGFVRPARSTAAPLQALFLSAATREKGLLDAIAGVAQANRTALAAGLPGTRLTVAGSFPSPRAAEEYAAAAPSLGAGIRYVGFVSGAAKCRLLAEADVLLFPTTYPHETQGLVVAEALAFDLPVIVTRWRAVAEGLPAGQVHVVEPGRVDQIATALAAVARAESPAGTLREHFLHHLTLERHLDALKKNLLQLAPVGQRAGTLARPPA